MRTFMNFIWLFLYFLWSFPMHFFLPISCRCSFLLSFSVHFPFGLAYFRSYFIRGNRIKYYILRKLYHTIIPTKARRMRTGTGKPSDASEWGEMKWRVCQSFEYFTNVQLGNSLFYEHFTKIVHIISTDSIGCGKNALV